MKKIETNISLSIGITSAEQVAFSIFYNSLDDPGGLDWNTTDDICTQTGVVCMPSGNIQLYFFFTFFFYFLSFQKSKDD